METAFKKYPIFLIHARTGCTCCSNENHYRGPFRTRDDAERRRLYYLDSSKGVNNPLASQYAPRGVYEIVEVEAEELPDGRVILENRIFPALEFAEVAEDGSGVDTEFCKELYPD